MEHLWNKVKIIFNGFSLKNLNDPVLLKWQLLHTNLLLAMSDTYASINK